MGSLELDMTERLHFHFSLSCIGEGNGNPLQCSCLENPRDGGAWWATVYGVTQSWTQLKRLSSSSNRSRRKQHFIILPKDIHVLEASLALGKQKSIPPPFLCRSTARSSTPVRWEIPSQESQGLPLPCPRLCLNLSFIQGQAIENCIRGPSTHVSAHLGSKALLLGPALFPAGQPL